MIENFPYGKAPFWLFALAVVSSLGVLATRTWATEKRPELVMLTFAPNHLAAYQQSIPAFEREHNVKVSVQLVHRRALEQRLQNAMLAGTPVPDLTEIVAGGISFFTRGPLKDVGFLDLTDRLARDGLRERIVESRLSLWSTRGRVFAIPHDVHPVMLMYRADLVEALDIDVNELDTWDKFVEVGKKVVKDLDGDGIPDRYMIDLPSSAAWGIQILMLQKDIPVWDEHGRVNFDREETVDTILWYIRQLFGPERIAYDCSGVSGQVGGTVFSKALTDGLALFYIAPDWRTYAVETEVPTVAGKMKLMPLPAWKKGGRRTSTWGGSGLAITRQSKNPELAWELAKTLYFDKKELGKRFKGTNILPALVDAWDLPEFSAPNPKFSGQRLGTMYAALAPDAPPDWSTPYKTMGEDRVMDAALRAIAYYKEKGEVGLRERIKSELRASRLHLEEYIGRNRLMKQ
jgi:arabinosaccharide transport system substrate-binding protein